MVVFKAVEIKEHKKKGIRPRSGACSSTSLEAFQRLTMYFEILKILAAAVTE
jgi:hypothetical protein